MPLLPYAGWIILTLGLTGAVYAVAAGLVAARRLHRRPSLRAAPLPAVTVFKPLHGDEPGLEAALASFLEQDYPAPVQIVFGLRDAADPAQRVAMRLRARFAGRDVTIVTDPALHGANAKVSNLINMMRAARHDVLVLADSDIAVPPTYLKAVASALSQPEVGAVSCLYAGKGLAGAWSRLSAMGIAYNFLPNAMVGIASGMAHPCFGSTIALRREMLADIGGLESFVNLLADDYEIGRAVRAAGRTIAYPPLAVQHHCTEASAGELIGHELRWARTIRTVDPAGHWGSFITHPLALGLIGASLLGFAPLSCGLLTVILLARLFLKAQIDQILGRSAGPAFILPLRDVLSFCLFIASLFGDAVEWRGHRLRVQRSGAISKL